MENERITVNPVPAFLKARKRRGLKEAQPRTRYLSHEEEAALLAAANQPLRDMLAFAIDTGLRLEEQLSLTWGQVDIRRQQIKTTADTKSGEARDIPLLQRAVTILGTVPRHIRRNGEPDWVFCKRDGSRYGSLKKSLATACRRAEISDFTWHDLRRTCGCRLLQDRRMTKAEVQEWLGHASVTTTERSYAFLKIDQLHKAAGTKPDTGAADSHADEA